MTPGNRNVLTNQENEQVWFLFRQLGHRSSVNKLVPLVQSLSQHINVFLVEYNKYNNLQLNLPGFRPTSTNNANNLIDADASGSNN